MMQNAWRQARAELEGIRQDHTSGSAELALRAALLVEKFLARCQALGPRKLRERLDQIAFGLVAAQPSMAPMFNLANAISLAREKSVDNMRAQVAQAITCFRRQLVDGPKAIARQFLRVVPRRANILTYSYSSTVLHALLYAQRAGKQIRVICSEGRPMLEGRRLATRLARAGVPVTFVVDALLVKFVGATDLVVFGADALLDRGFINKAGTSALVRAAEEAGAPVYVLADRTKLLPRAGERFLVERVESAVEVWPRRPERVNVLNLYFERVAWRPGVRIVTDAGLRTPPQVRRELGRLPVAKFFLRLTRKRPSVDFAPRLD